MCADLRLSVGVDIERFLPDCGGFGKVLLQHYPRRSRCFFLCDVFGALITYEHGQQQQRWRIIMRMRGDLRLPRGVDSGGFDKVPQRYHPYLVALFYAFPSTSPALSNGSSWSILF